MSERPERGDTGEWVWGRNAVIEALRAGRGLREILVAYGVRPGFLEEIQRSARERGIPVHQVDRARLAPFGDRHQGVAARAEAFRYVTPDDLLAVAAERGEEPLLLIADGVQDPQNLGTLIRTLAAVSGHGVILPRHRAAGISPGVVKASAGTVQMLGVAQVTNIPRTVEDLRERHVWVAGLAGDGPARLRDLPATDALALVVGSEDRGLARLTRERCDLVVSLPVSGRVESLNAAVAGSIALYHVWQQRHPN